MDISLPYGLHVGDRLADDTTHESTWIVEPWGLSGDPDWDWEGIESNGGLGTLDLVIVSCPADGVDADA